MMSLIMVETLVGSNHRNRKYRWIAGVQSILRIVEIATWQAYPGALANPMITTGRIKKSTPYLWICHDLNRAGIHPCRAWTIPSCTSCANPSARCP